MYKKGHRSPAESEWTQSMFFCLSQHHKQNWKDLFLHPTQIKLLLVHAIPVNKKKKSLNMLYATFAITVNNE